MYAIRPELQVWVSARAEERYFLLSFLCSQRYLCLSVASRRSLKTLNIKASTRDGRFYVSYRSSSGQMVRYLKAVEEGKYFTSAKREKEKARDASALPPVGATSEPKLGLLFLFRSNHRGGHFPLVAPLVCPSFCPLCSAKGRRSSSPSPSSSPPSPPPLLWRTTQKKRLRASRISFCPAAPSAAKRISKTHSKWTLFMYVSLSLCVWFWHFKRSSGSHLVRKEEAEPSDLQGTDYWGGRKVKTGEMGSTRALSFSPSFRCLFAL